MNLYCFALQAQKESIRNRSGGRINQGIIELLVPVVAAQCLFERGGFLSIDDLLKKTVDVMKGTFKGDVDYLIEMKRFAYDLCRYNDRSVPDHPEAGNVYEYYAADLASSTNPTGIAHNGEFVNGFPTVNIMYNSIINSKERTFVKKVEEAYRLGIERHDKSIGRGFLADCIAAAIYLVLSQNPKIRLIV